MGQWAAGAAMGFLALLGLVCVSRAVDGMFAVFGTLLFVFGLAAVIVLVHRATDYSSASEAEEEESEGRAAA